MKYTSILDRDEVGLTLRRSTAVAALVRGTTALTARVPSLRALHLLEALPDHVRGILLPVVARWFPDGDLALREDMHVGIHRDLVDLLVDLGMVEHKRPDRLVLAEPYRGAVRTGPDGVERILQRSRRGPLRRIRRRQEWVRGLTADVFRDGADVGAMDGGDDLYLLHLAHYLEELGHMSLTAQVPARLSQRFYSDLGSLAYRLYTGPRVRELCAGLRYDSFLDVGCGNGRHLRAAAEAAPEAEVVGIDLQADVVDEAREALRDLPRVAVHHGDVLDWDPGRSFDVVFACYMVFYLSEDQRRVFFARVADMLADDGRFVLTQYFPDAPHIQRALIDQTSPVPRLQEHLTRVGVSLCRAETLLNRCLDAFQTVAQWETLLPELEAAGLEVESVHPADDMYYSLFLVIRRTARREEAAG